MVSDVLLTLVVAILGSTGLVSFITYLITRRDNRKNENLKIQKQLEKLEKDTVRTQLLMLMANYSGDHNEIMRCAEHYFKDIKGNWYMTTLFMKFIEENNISQPDWLEKE